MNIRRPNFKIWLWDHTVDHTVDLNARSAPIKAQVIMPGYEAKTVKPLKAALVCPECNLLLRDAVQTGDGIRLCESCFEQVTSKCKIPKPRYIY